MFIKQQGVSTVSTDVRLFDHLRNFRTPGSALDGWAREELGASLAWQAVRHQGGAGAWGWEDETFRFRFHGVFDDLDGFSH